MQRKRIEQLANSRGIVVLFILIYAFCGFLLGSLSRIGDITLSRDFDISATALNGVIIQIQLITLIGLCNFSTWKMRFNWAYFLCVLSFLYAFMAVFFAHIHDAIPGIFVPFANIVIVYFMRLYQMRNEQFIIALESKQTQLEQIIYRDLLTGLPNRKMIVEQLNLMIGRAVKEKLGFSVVFIDLDNFKQINDIYGHDIGDKFLITIAETMQKYCNELDLLGRLGGDEFILIIQRNMTESEVYKYIDGLRKLLSEEVLINDCRSTSSASFGIASFPHDGNDAMELLKYADTAMYNAKNQGKNAITFFHQGLHQNLMKKLAFEHDLSMALANQELYLVFQPQYTTQRKELRGFEVLLRWDSPLHGKVPPDRFISVAEETGLIISIGEWVLRQSCKVIKRITQLKDYRNIIISVNISAIQVMDSEFLSMVERVLEDTGVNTNNLEFEVTESVFIGSLEKVTYILKEIRKKGIRVALDDFGTGYSSLNYLQMLPISTLKIDKSFVDNIGSNENSGKIIGSLIAMSHQLGMNVVAEGVEREEQKEYLMENNCDFIQGYFWGKPLAESEMNMLLYDTMENNKKISGSA